MVLCLRCFRVAACVLDVLCCQWLAQPVVGAVKMETSILLMSCFSYTRHSHQLKKIEKICSNVTSTLNLTIFTHMLYLNLKQKLLQLL
jgi:hypothetical protein